MSLANIARQYRAESLRPAGHKRQQDRADAAHTAAFLNWCITNRTPDDHHVTHATPTWHTADWARRYGYYVTVADISDGAIVLALRRDTDRLIATLPAHLHWDGHRIVLDTT
ncbi:hypothetical protein [Streptomyces omiyaensis]|uniref:hypothetical protein n=1 Tax=Streptomyces omiyaensis TaxID=68247 RepID=UPI0036FE1BAE